MNGPAGQKLKCELPMAGPGLPGKSVSFLDGRSEFEQGADTVYSLDHLTSVMCLTILVGARLHR
jgi:hypothetical protein